MLVSAKAGVALFYVRIWLALFNRMSCGNLLNCAGLLRWVKESTRSTRAMARSGKGTGEVRLWIAKPERGMFSPELFLSLLKLIYGRAHEGIGTIELMPLAGTIFATRRMKLSQWKVKTISARCSVTWPMSPSLPLRSGNWGRASWKQHKNFLPAST